MPPPPLCSDNPPVKTGLCILRYASRSFFSFPAFDIKGGILISYTGYIIAIVIGAVLTLIGSLLSSSRTWEFLNGSKREGLVEESLYTRRLGTCIGGEGILIVVLSGVCMERDAPIPFFIILPISVVICAVLLYFIHRSKPV